MRVVRVLTVVYGLICLIASAYFLHQAHYAKIVQNSPYYVNNRFYVMSIFFPRWEAITKAYDPSAFDTRTPKWYDVIREESRFAMDGEMGKSMQEARAEEYIRQFVEESAGIDHNRVKDWLLEIVDYINRGISGYSYENVFLRTGIENQIAETHLLQVLSFIPIREHWKIFLSEGSLFLLFFPFLFGMPLLIVQLVHWGYCYVKRKKLITIGLSRKSTLIILLFASIIGTFYFINGAIEEYETAKMTSFVSGNWFWLKMALLYGGVSFAATFVGFWGLMVMKEAFFSCLNPTKHRNSQVIKI